MAARNDGGGEARKEWGKKNRESRSGRLMARLHRAARQGARYRGHEIAGSNEPKVVAGRGKWKELFSLFLPNFKILFFSPTQDHIHIKYVLKIFLEFMRHLEIKYLIKGTNSWSIKIIIASTYQAKIHAPK
jgi:hypothetical protein